VNLYQQVKTSYKNARFEVVTTVKFQAEVFWVVTKCSVLEGMQR